MSIGTMKILSQWTQKDVNWQCLEYKPQLLPMEPTCWLNTYVLLLRIYLQTPSRWISRHVNCIFCYHTTTCSKAHNKDQLVGYKVVCSQPNIKFCSQTLEVVTYPVISRQKLCCKICLLHSLQQRDTNHNCNPIRQQF